jgi:magnesium chelatase family protein
VVHVHPTPPTELSRAPQGEASALVATRIATARQVQRSRYGEDGPATNAEADLDRIALEPEARALAEQAAERLRLSSRGFTRVLRVARSIADLADVALVRRADVAEALAYRHRIPGRP